MLLKLTIPPQKTDSLEIYFRTEAIFEVIGYYKYETLFYQHWVLSTNTPFISTTHPFSKIILKKDPSLQLDLCWKG